MLRPGFTEEEGFVLGLEMGPGRMMKGDYTDEGYRKDVQHTLFYQRASVVSWHILLAQYLPVLKSNVEDIFSFCLR